MKRTRYFQWVDGEFSGNVEVLDDITCIDGEYFYNFKSGEVCNLRYISKMTNSPSSLAGKVMVEIASPQDPWVATTVTTKRYTNAGTDETVDIPPLEDITAKTTSGTGQSLTVEHSNVGTKQYTPPRFRGPFSDLPSLDEYMRSEPEPVLVQTPKPVYEEPSSSVSERHDELDKSSIPVYDNTPAKTPEVNTVVENKPQNTGPIAILAKTCKKHSTDINITVTMDLPSRAVFSMVSEEFENGGAEFIDCLISNLDVNDVIDSIKSALVLAYSKNES